MRGIQKQAVGKDDVFIFYYSGHGYRKKNDPLFVPRISIKKEQKKDENFLCILKEIFEKGVALTIVLLDCCNSYMGKGVCDEDELLPHFNLEQYKNGVSTDAVVKILQKKGIILACSSAPGEISWGGISNDKYKKIGSLFSDIFLAQVFENLKTRDASWLEILKNAQNICEDESQKTPYQDMYIASEMAGNSHDHFYQKPLFKLWLCKHPKTPEKYLKWLTRCGGMKGDKGSCEDVVEIEDGELKTSSVISYMNDVFAKFQDYE
jgi:hypothetical protein